MSVAALDHPEPWSDDEVAETELVASPGKAPTFDGPFLFRLEIASLLDRRHRG
jgi:hypothetical protein